MRVIARAENILGRSVSLGGAGSGQDRGGNESSGEEEVQLHGEGWC